jgi:hypothetical protein
MFIVNDIGETLAGFGDVTRWNSEAAKGILKNWLFELANQEPKRHGITNSQPRILRHRERDY